ncbi:hypothetical protein E4U43_003940, partial [Claviceps pusilla]
PLLDQTEYNQRAKNRRVRISGDSQHIEMRFDVAFVAATLLSAVAAGIIGPQQQMMASSDLVAPDDHDLFKRKGGGGGGSRGGGGGGGSSGGGRSGGSSGSSGNSGGSGGSGSSGGSRGSGSSGSGGSYVGFSSSIFSIFKCPAIFSCGKQTNFASRPNTGSSSNFGGTSRGGSGPPRAFGGGRYYGGGAASPYRSGLATAAGVGAVALAAGAALAFWPGVWHHGANLYPHRNDFSFYNSTTRATERLPVVCGCAQYEECACDENEAALRELVGDGTYEALNKSIINVGDYRGRKTLLINGTLPNGTTADGPDSAGFGTTSLTEIAVYWSLAAAVLATVFVL